MDFRLLVSLALVREQLLRLGENLLYAIVVKSSSASGQEELKGYLHLATSLLKARDGTSTRWRELLPFLVDAISESAPGSMPDRDVKTLVMNDSALLLEMGSADSAPRKQDHFAILAKCTMLKEVVEMDPELYIRCYSQFQAITRSNMLEENGGIPVTRLNRWQWDVHRRLLRQDNRKILFVVDSVGNRGKTYLSLYMDQRYGEAHASLAEMKQHDMAFIVSRQLRLKTVIFDYSRNWKPEFFAWTLFEQLKNGRVLSGKYESVVAKYPLDVKVAVFTNHDPSPEFHRLSADRISVVNLDHEYSIHGPALSELLDEDPEETQSEAEEEADF